MKTLTAIIILFFLIQAATAQETAYLITIEKGRQITPVITRSPEVADSIFSVYIPGFNTVAVLEKTPFAEFHIKGIIIYIEKKTVKHMRSGKIRLMNFKNK